MHKPLNHIIIALLVLTCTLSAQKYNFKNYQVDDGLSLTQISYVIQASSGHLYLGTYGGGLNVFDGIEFKVFNSRDGLIDNTIYSIAEDENGTIWIATERGLGSLKGKHFKNYYVKDGLPSNDIYTVQIVEGNKLIIATANGLTILDVSEETFTKIEMPDNIQYIISLHASDRNNMLIGTYYGLYEMRDGKISRKFSSAIDSTHEVRKIYKDRKGIYWVATNKGLFKFIKDNYYRYQMDDGLIDNSIFWIEEDNLGMLWIATDKGLSRFDGNNFKNFSAKEGFTNSKTWCITLDREGILWYGTDEGLYSLNNQEFKLFDKLDGYQTAPWAITEDIDDNILLGTHDQGLIKIIDESITEVKSDYFKNTTIWSLLKDSKDRIWAGIDSGVVKLQDGTFTYYSAQQGLEVSGGVSSIFEDKSGNIWLGTGYTGLYYYNGVTFNHVTNSTGKEFDFIYSITQDVEGNIWAGTDKGIIKKVDNSIIIPEELVEVSNNSFISVLSKNDKLIFGSFELGVLVYDHTAEDDPEKIDTIDVSKGLNDNSVLLMTFDNYNNLWVGTNMGINKIDYQTYIESGELNIISFNKYDGLPGIETTQNAVYKDSKGNLWFGNVDGVLNVNPQKVEANWLEPITVINDFQVIASQPKVEYKSVLDLVKNSFDEYFQIPYDNNSVTIDYVGINLTNPNSVQYRFRITGSDWSPLTSNTRVSYSSLSPGKYTFQVISKNKNNIWNFSPASVQFEIVAPFWRSIWFYIIVSGVVLLAIYGLYKLRVSTITRQNKELEERIKFRLKYEKELEKSERELLAAKEKAERSDALKSEFLAQMSHEIRTPVNSILNFSNLLKNEMIDKINNELKEGFSIIESGGRRLIRTIDSILNMSQIQTDSFEVFPTELDLSDILGKLIREFHNAAYQKGIELNFSSEDNIGKIEGDEYTISQLFANLIDNAIKYTNDGSITIEIKKDSDDFIVVNVTDTGVGISEEFQANLFQPFSQEETGYTRKFEGNGLGLALVKKYCEINNAKIFCNSKKGEGTTFTVVFMEVKQPVEN